MMALEDEEWRELSNREIARMCAVDHKTVGNIRAEIKRLSGEIPQSAELPNSLTPVYNVPIIQEYKRQINELSEKLANQTPPDTSIAVQQAVRQERERAELAMYEYKKKARELEAQMQAVRSTPAPQPVIEVREVVPDDVKARLEEREAELKKLQETLEAHKKAGKDLAGIEEKINERYKAYRKLLEKCDKDEEKAKMGIELGTAVMNLTDFLTKHKGYYEHLVRYGAPTHISAGRIKQAAGLCAEISELLYTAAKTISSKEGEFIDV